MTMALTASTPESGTEAPLDLPLEFQGWRTRGRRRLQLWLAQGVLLVAIAGIWEAGVRLGWLNEFFTSRPLAVASFLVHAVWTGAIFADTWITLEEALLAFVLAAVTGVLSGFVLYRYAAVRRLLSPFLTALNSMPRVALAPLFIVWFGIGVGSKVALGFSLVYFIILMNTMAGAESVDVDLLVIARSLGASERRIFFQVTLPGSVPSIFAGLQLGLIYAVLAVVVGEMLASPRGLGQQIQYSAGIMRMDAVLGALVFLAMVTVGLASCLDLVKRHLLRWHADRR